MQMKQSIPTLKKEEEILTLSLIQNLDAPKGFTQWHPSESPEL